MRKVNVSDVIGNSKLNKFFLSIFFIILICIIINGYAQSVFGTALPVQMEDTGLDSTTFGLIGSITMYGMMAGGIIFGILSDKIGRLRTFMLGVIIFSIGTGIYGFMDSEVGFTICRVFAGIGAAGAAPVGISIVSEYTPKKNRTTLVSYVTAGVPIGNIITPLLGIAMLPALGWRAMYYVGFAFIIMVFAIFMFIPESMERLIAQGNKETITKTLCKADPGFVPSDDDEYVTFSTSKSSSSITNLFRGGMARNTVLFWVIFACMMFFSYGMSTWLPKLMTLAGYELGSSLMFMSVFALGSVPSIGISGWFSGKVGYKNAIISFLALAAALLLLMIFKPGTTLLYIMLFFIGAGIYGAIALVYTFIAVNYPNAVRGSGVGIASSAGRLGGSFGPMIGGILVARNASLFTNFFVFAIAAIIAAVCVALTKDNSKNVA